MYFFNVKDTDCTMYIKIDNIWTFFSDLKNYNCNMYLPT